MKAVDSSIDGVITATRDSKTEFYELIMSSPRREDHEPPTIPRNTSCDQSHRSKCKICKDFQLLRGRLSIRDMQAMRYRASVHDIPALLKTFADRQCLVDEHPHYSMALLQ